MGACDILPQVDAPDCLHKTHDPLYKHLPDYNNFCWTTGAACGGCGATLYCDVLSSLGRFSLVMASAGTLCSSPGCGKPVTSNLACPKCMQLGLSPTYFCSQDCFKTNYNTHKQVHSLAKQIIEAQGYVPRHLLSPYSTTLVVRFLTNVSFPCVLLHFFLLF